MDVVWGSPGRLNVGGTFGYELGVEVKRVRFLGVLNKPGKMLIRGRLMWGESGMGGVRCWM